MPVDPDDLAVAALRRADARSEELDGDHPHPLALDDREMAELDSFRRVVAVGRSVQELDRELTAPPADLWARIEADAVSDGHPSTAAPGPLTTATPIHGAGAATPPADVTGARRGPGGGEIVELSSRRARPTTLLAVAAAAMLLLAAVGVWATSSDGPGDELVASTDLSLLAGGGTGTAELRQRDDGVHLVVDVAGLSPAERADFYELWLLTAEGGDPQSVLKFDEPEGRLDVLLPEGMDTSTFPVVDISEEVDDGDDTHSGLSILRGSFS
jgi:hypothetical protein